MPPTNDTATLLREISAALDEIAARGTFADADSKITDGLDAAQRYADQALKWLGEDAPTGRFEDFYPSLGFAQLGLVRRAS